jgi:hypothetical protein
MQQLLFRIVGLNDLNFNRQSGVFDAYTTEI